MLGVIRNQLLDFFLCYWNLSDFILDQYRVKRKTHYTSLEEVTKKSFMTENFQQ